MDTRREFIRKAMLLSGMAGWNGMVPESIQKALSILPESGSTYLDAEHVVILMQENRSFDHCFGTLQGVRGFNDPRYARLPNGNPVWAQSNRAGETHLPFRFDIRDTKITWMGSVPHSRSSQVDASNEGRHDHWLDSKRSSNKEYADMPLTMGHYTREDLPFNYALADAFTICDQHFCSGMTSTWPNRLFLWTGTVRGERSGDAKAFIRNVIPYGEAHWTTFPELLEQQGIPWKVYQNDITDAEGLNGEESAWLSNFGCNQLESFTQYNMRFAPGWRKRREKQRDALTKDIEALKAAIAAGGSDQEKHKQTLSEKEESRKKAEEDIAKWSPENFERLSDREKNLFHKAFTTNIGDPDYHQLAPLSFEENGIQRTLNVPKGDILHQFRQDVNNKQLPAVSWLVGPENFSDHPTAPWYGAWLVSEVLDILTNNPEIWKKTIFILTYDENDGYFDHVPSFTAPDPLDPQSGKCSAGIDTAVEYIRREQELQEGVEDREARTGPVGLGFRVPMIIASPWTRGGRVCSQVFDHTSVFRFVQQWLHKKRGVQIEENNISSWRRTVSGDLTSAFRPYTGAEPEQLPWLQKNAFIESIYNAKFKKLPENFKPLTTDEIALMRQDPHAVSAMPKQEKGTRPSCALPYQLYADGRLSADKKNLEIKLEASNAYFGPAAAGSPFQVRLPGRPAMPRNYALSAGDSISDLFSLELFDGKSYHLNIHGPNGFFRDLKGDLQDPLLRISCDYTKDRQGRPTGGLEFLVQHEGKGDYHLEIRDNSYKNALINKTIAAGRATRIPVDTGKQSGWYDISILVNQFPVFERRYAGRVETGKDSISDPAMGGMV
ncbi:MAG TPA: phospholipase C, phosphocholine-specific [Puia sp.]|nr:phospholipase C, phosphocholine-specific [Puia sp.]